MRTQGIVMQQHMYMYTETLSQRLQQRKKNDGERKTENTLLSTIAYMTDNHMLHDFLMLFSVNRSALYSYGSHKVMRKLWRALRRWHERHP